MRKIDLLSPFKTMLITIGQLPTAYIESMSYYEGLCYLVNYLCNNVIPAVTSNGEAVIELQNKYLELVDYVEHYFDNLDVQDEINNKLDDMAEQGELSQIILDYLQMNGLLMFDTLADLKAAENLIEGSFCEIIGKLAYNDGEIALYKVREKQVSDVADDDELVALTNYDSLIAEKIHDKALKDLDDKIGALSDLDTTDKSSIVNAINDSLDYTDTQVGIIDTKIGDLSELDTTDKDSVVDAINETLVTINNKEYKLYDNHVRLYIDGVNGSDDNDGATAETALKTLDKFLQLLNTTKADIRAYIVSAGTYKFTKTTITDAAIHITGTVSGVILSTDEDELVFYGGHVNFNNLTVSLDPSVSHYYDGTLVTFDNVIYTAPVRVYGGSIDSEDCTYNVLRLSWTKASLDNTTIDTGAKTNDAIHCDSSTTLSIFNGLTVKHITESSTYGVIGLYRSVCFVLDAVTNQTNSGDYAYGFRGNYFILGTNTTSLNAVKGIGTSNQLDHALVFTGSQDLPIS